MSQNVWRIFLRSACDIETMNRAGAQKCGSRFCFLRYKDIKISKDRKNIGNIPLSMHQLTNLSISLADHFSSHTRKVRQLIH